MANYPGCGQLTAALFAIIILPPIVFYSGASSSFAVGTTAAAALLVAIFAQRVVYRETAGRAQPVFAALTPLGLSLLLLTFVAGHAAIAWTYQPFDFTRALLSSLSMPLILVGGIALGDALQDANPVAVDGTLKRCFVFFLAAATIGITGLSPPSLTVWNKPVFPFSEPSTFALSFAPFLVYRCVRARGAARYSVLFIGCLVALLLQNLTLLVGCALTALICLRSWALLLMIGALVLGVGAIEFIDLSYFSSRLDFSDTSGNLSALVYLQGWQLIGESLQNSAGWGLGFQQLGGQGTDVPAAQMIYTLLGDNLNLRDGGFAAAKLVSEFGAAGLLLIIGYLVILLRSFRRVRAIARGAVEAPARTLAHCVIVAYSIELFVRGVGYFSGNAILAVAALWLLRAATQASRQKLAASSGYSRA